MFRISKEDLTLFFEKRNIGNGKSDHFFQKSYHGNEIRGIGMRNSNHFFKESYYGKKDYTKKDDDKEEENNNDLDNNTEKKSIWQ